MQVSNGYIVEFMHTQFVTSDDRTLIGDLLGSGSGPAIIFLHGGGQTRHSWDHAMRRATGQGYVALSYDARGHGESDWSPDGDYRISRLAEDLRSVRASLATKVALVGASMGGMTSLHAVGNEPAGFADALVLVDIVPRPATAGTNKIRAFMLAHQDGFATIEEAADAVAAYNPARPRPADVNGLGKNLRLRDDGRYYWHWDLRLLSTSPASEPPAFQESLVEASARVKIPTMLVKGGQSDIVDDEGISEMCRLIPQTEICEVPGAGHMVVGDKNDAFNDGLFEFLSRHLPPEAG